MDAEFVGDDPPGVQRFQRVVVGAEPPEVLLAGGPACFDRDDVIDLETLVLATATDATAGTHARPSGATRWGYRVWVRRSW
jgi:hypothetical protein